MFRKNRLLINLILLTILISVLLGCSSDDYGLGPAPYPNDNTVFVDNFGSSIEFQAFSGSKLDALQIENSDTYSGSLGLVITVPDSGDASGSYAGGALVASIARNLTDYNCLTFWAKADKEITLDVAGIGNDNTGTSIYTAEVNGFALTTTWQQYVIPIPEAGKLISEKGMFYFAEGPENGIGCTIWIDEIIFDSLATITNPRPVITTQTIDVEAGATIDPGNGSVTFDVAGTDLFVSAMASYFDYTSSNTAIVSVGANNLLTAAGVGTATVTAKLGEVAATGTITVNVISPASVPTTPAPAPTVDPSNVVSLFSDTYTDVTVNSWSTDWDITDLEDITIGSDSVKKYYNLTYAGIEFNDPTVDASSMTRFHMDIWTPNSTASPATFKVKLVDFGANGVYGGGDDVEHELTFDHNSLSSETWVSIDVPLTSFSNLTTTGHLSQMIISGDLSIVYVDNIYFYDAGVQSEPSTSAPTPSENADSVVSLFSDAYTSANVDTWSAVYDDADVADFTIGSDNLKQYTNLNYAIIDFRNSSLDVSAMTHFHLDLWTPDQTFSQNLKIKFVDLGTDGVYGGGDDVEHEVTFNDATLNTAVWVGIDIPLTDLTGLVTKESIGQLIITSSLSTIFIDNIYFYDSGIPTVPNTPAPTPTHLAADVISMFSDAYTDVPIDTWSASWDSATVADFLIGSDNVKKYTYLLFAGIEFVNPTIDASEMNYFHMDVWTPDPTDDPAYLRIKIVDFGANGVWDGGGDDVEHELELDGSVMNSNSWVSLDIPITDFVNLTTRGHLAQLIISGTPNTIYVDNVYFHK